MQIDDGAEISLSELLEMQEQPDVTSFSDSDIIHLNALEIGEHCVIPIFGGFTKIKRIK